MTKVQSSMPDQPSFYSQSQQRVLDDPIKSPYQILPLTSSTVSEFSSTPPASNENIQLDLLFDNLDSPVLEDQNQIYTSQQLSDLQGLDMAINNDSLFQSMSPTQIQSAEQYDLGDCINQNMTNIKDICQPPSLTLHDSKKVNQPATSNCHPINFFIHPLLDLFTEDVSQLYSFKKDKNAQNIFLTSIYSSPNESPSKHCTYRCPVNLHPLF